MATLKVLATLVLLMFIVSCKDQKEASPVKDQGMGVDNPSIFQIKKELESKGFQTFDYIDEKTKDTILMQQYFIAFLKTGPNRGQSEKEADSLQKLHLEHLGRMYELGYADISGPFGDDGEIRGITIYNVPTLHIADSLANLDQWYLRADWL